METETNEIPLKKVDEEDMENVKKFINTILDDILTNTYSFLQLRTDLRGWRNQDELFDIGFINREIHKQIIKKLKKKWFSLYLTQDNRWKRKMGMYKNRL